MGLRIPVGSPSNYALPLSFSSPDTPASHGSPPLLQRPDRLARGKSVVPRRAAAATAAWRAPLGAAVAAMSDNARAERSSCPSSVSYTRSCS